MKIIDLMHILAQAANEFGSDTEIIVTGEQQIQSVTQGQAFDYRIPSSAHMATLHERSSVRRAEEQVVNWLDKMSKGETNVRLDIGQIQPKIKKVLVIAVK